VSDPAKDVLLDLLVGWIFDQHRCTGRWPTAREVYVKAKAMGLDANDPDRQPMNSEGVAVDDATSPCGLAQTTTPSGACPPLGARNADQPPPPAQEQSGTTAGPLSTRT
jgi:hypothetical protein